MGGRSFHIPAPALPGSGTNGRRRYGHPLSPARPSSRAKYLVCLTVTPKTDSCKGSLRACRLGQTRPDQWLARGYGCDVDDVAELGQSAGVAGPNAPTVVARRDV